MSFTEGDDFESYALYYLEVSTCVPHFWTLHNSFALVRLAVYASPRNVLRMSCTPSKPQYTRVANGWLLKMFVMCNIRIGELYNWSNVGNDGIRLCGVVEKVSTTCARLGRGTGFGKSGRAM